MTTANATTGVTGALLVDGEFDKFNPPSYSQQWWSNPTDMDKPVQFKSIKLGDLLGLPGWDLISNLVADDGVNLREVVEYGMPAGSITRQIRTAKNLYIKRGSVYKVVAL